MVALSPLSPAMAPSTGCASLISTRRRCSARSSMPSLAADSCFPQLAPFEISRRYLPGTNVLETTFTTNSGVVRITDALTLPSGPLSPQRELVRSVEGVAGSVSHELGSRGTLRFRCQSPPGSGRRAGVPVATQGADAVAVCSWGIGEPKVMAGSMCGTFEVTAGARVLFALSAAHQEPLVLPSRSRR